MRLFLLSFVTILPSLSYSIDSDLQSYVTNKKIASHVLREQNRIPATEVLKALDSILMSPSQFFRACLQLPNSEEKSVFDKNFRLFLNSHRIKAKIIAGFKLIDIQGWMMTKAGTNNKVCNVEFIFSSKKESRFSLGDQYIYQKEYLEIINNKLLDEW